MDVTIPVCGVTLNLQNSKFKNTGDTIKHDPSRTRKTRTKKQKMFNRLALTTNAQRGNITVQPGKVCVEIAVTNPKLGKNGLRATGSKRDDRPRSNGKSQSVERLNTRVSGQGPKPTLLARGWTT